MADISTITASNGTTYNIKDSTARNTLIPKDTNGNTSNLIRPLQLNGVGDLTLDGKIDEIRANRLAFLPADQIIVEKTTDGGVTWTDAGISDNGKLGIFSQTNTQYAINIPLKNGVRSIDCGVRITFTAMKYDVPDGTPEYGKYNYWNSSYVLSAERYCRLKELYFFVSAVNDGIGITVQRAKGNDSNNWSTIYTNSSYAMTGWSGPDYVRFNQDTFGGGRTQVGQYWNYRLILMTRGANGGTTLSTTYTTTKQSIIRIKGYGDAVWTSGNNLMVNDHLYDWDINKNVTFPAKVSASNLPSAPIKTYTSLTGTAAVTTSPYYCARYDVTDSSVTEYTDGMMVSIRVPVAGNGSYGTALQINSLGYKPIVYNVNSMISTRYGVGSQITAVYNSTQTATLYLNSSSATTVTGCWQVMDYYSGDAITSYRVREYYAVLKVNSASPFALHRYMIVLSMMDGTLVPYSNGNNQRTTYTKTINTTNAFNPFGNIYYYANTSDVNAGSTVADGILYPIYGQIDWRYSFNIYASGIARSTAFALNEPIYIKAKYNYNTRTAVLVPDASSSNYLERSSVVQDLPTSNPDNALTADETYIYIYIGVPNNKYAGQLIGNKTVYNWDAVNNCIQVFDGNRPEAVVFVNQSSTFSEIYNIKQKGKIPIYKDADGFAFPEQVEDSSPSGFTFTKATDAGVIKWYKVDTADAWTNGTKDTIELYWCTYGSTTYNQITQALAAGKLPVLIDSFNIYYVYTRNDANLHQFKAFRTNVIMRTCRVNASNGWTTLDTTMQTTDNLVTSISASSDDSHYPSAKCVYNAIQSAGGHSTTYYAQNQSVSNGNNVTVTAPSYYAYGQYFVDITGYIYSNSRTTRVYLKPTNSSMDIFFGEITDCDPDGGLYMKFAVMLEKVSSTSYTFRCVDSQQESAFLDVMKKTNMYNSSHTLTNFGVIL